MGVYIWAHGVHAFRSSTEPHRRYCDVRRVPTTPLHPQVNECVERWNRTLVPDLFCFFSTGSEDWDSHVALACFWYNTGVRVATVITNVRGNVCVVQCACQAETEV